MELAAAFEVKLLGSQRNINGLEERIAHVAATGPDVRQRVYLDPAAVHVVLGRFVPEVYAGVGVGEFDALDANFVGVICLWVEPAGFVNLYLEGLRLWYFNDFLCFCFHVYQILDKGKHSLSIQYTELKIFWKF